MCLEKSAWDKAVEFHGHACPGLAIGFKAAGAAIEVLGDTRDIDEEIVAVVENDSCAVDAIQSMLGCTAGKGNLIFCHKGKHVYIIGRRRDDKAVRIALKHGLLAAAEPGESREQKMERILQSDSSDLFVIKEVKVELPKRAVIFNTVQCARCGEGVMESKARLRDGAIVCPDCFLE